jgi:hypothetical protein
MNTPGEPQARWRKSSHSGGNEGNCVEVGDLGGRVGVRDSKNPAAAHLVLSRRGFSALLAVVGARG